MNASQKIVVIPTYNEAENIRNLLPKLLEIGLDVLVVDDNSPDKTSDVVFEFSQKHPNIFLLSRKSKLGIGSAYREGYQYVLKKGYSYIIQMDADFSHTVSDLTKMLGHINEADVLIGSRYVSGGGTVGWKKSRMVLSKLANKYSKILGGHNVVDSTSGFRIYTAYSLYKNGFDKTKSDGYGFQIEMTYRSISQGLVIKEVPIIFYERQEGKSKMNLGIIFEALILVIKLRFLK